MPVHHSTQGWITGCGIDLEHLGETDRAVEGLSQVDCDSCLEDVERSRIWHIMAQEPSYQVGYEDGKSKAFFEMANWRPDGHAAGCGCEPCLTGGVISRYLAEAWVIEAITMAIDGHPNEGRPAELQGHVSGSAKVQELLEAGAWVRAITETYNQARIAVLAENE